MRLLLPDGSPYASDEPQDIANIVGTGGAILTADDQLANVSFTSSNHFNPDSILVDGIPLRDAVATVEPEYTSQTTMAEIPLPPGLPYFVDETGQNAGVGPEQNDSSNVLLLLGVAAVAYLVLKK